MELSLIIAEKHPNILAIWTEVFRGTREVTLLDADFQTLSKMPGIDALLVIGRFAHERYGGRPKPGESDILSSKGEAGMPLWIVTKASFVGHLERRVQADGSVKDIIVTDHELTPAEEAHIIFTKALERIKQFNRRTSEPRIRTLGFEVDSIHSLYGHPREEAEAVRRAYFEHFQGNS